MTEKFKNLRLWLVEASGLHPTGGMVGVDRPLATLDQRS